MEKKQKTKPFKPLACEELCVRTCDVSSTLLFRKFKELALFILK